MRKIQFVSGLMMAAIVALTGCQTEVSVDKVPGRTLTVVASTDNDTKTTNSGLSTLWAENDAISVFYAEPTGAYKGTKMTLSDGAGTKTGTFEAKDFETPSGTNDWYAIYPYNSKTTTPASANADGGYTYIGRSDGLKQQKYNDMSVLGGSNCPMYAVSKNVTGAPGFYMKQLASVIEFNVVNKTESPIKIKKVELDESGNSEYIVGSFYVNITRDVPIYTPSDGYSKSIAYTTITEPDPLDVNGVAKVYMIVKPFTHNTQNEFKIHIEGEVNGKAASTEVLLNPVGDQCVFSAGKIKRVTVNVAEFVVEPDPTFVFNTEDGLAALGIAVPEQGKGINLDESPNNKFVSSSNVAITFNKGTASTNCRVWNSSGTLDLRLYKGSSFIIDAPEGYSVTKAVFAGSSLDGISGLSYGTWTGKSSSIEFSVSGSSKINTITVTFEEGSTEPVVEPKLIVNPSSLSFAAAGATKTVSVSSDDDNWTINSDDIPSWITVTKAVETSGVSVTASANTGEARTGKFTLTHSNGSLTATVNVSQEAYVAPATTSISGAYSTGKHAVENVVVTMVGYQSIFIKDDTGHMRVNMGSAANLAGLNLSKGDIVNVSGNVTNGDNSFRFNNTTANPVTVEKVGTGSSISPVSWSGTDVTRAYENTLNGAYITITATHDASAKIFSVAGSEVKLYVREYLSGVTDPKENDECTITGYVYGWSLYNDVKQIMIYPETVEVIGGTSSETLTLSTTSLSFKKEGGSEEVTVTSDDANWTIDTETVPEWLTAVKSSDKITFTASVNEEAKRSATVKVNHSNGSLTASVKVSQEGAVASDNLSLSPATLNFDASPTGPGTVEVTSNNDAWTVDQETVAEWLTVTRDGNTAIVAANPNTGAARTCTVKFHHATNSDINANLVINQKVPESGNTVTYTKVTSADAITSGRYLIVFEDGENSVALDGGLANFSKENWMGVTLSGNSITVADGHYMEYDADAKTLKSASGLYFESANAKNNGLYTSDSVLEDYAANFVIVLSYDTDNNIGVVACTLSDGEHRFRWNASDKYFRFYRPGSSITTEIQLYKQN